jgi:hypothetical protein
MHKTTQDQNSEQTRRISQTEALFVFMRVQRGEGGKGNGNGKEGG